MRRASSAGSGRSPAIPRYPTHSPLASPRGADAPCRGGRRPPDLAGKCGGDCGASPTFYRIRQGPPRPPRPSTCLKDNRRRLGEGARRRNRLGAVGASESSRAPQRRLRRRPALGILLHKRSGLEKGRRRRNRLGSIGTSGSSRAPPKAAPPRPRPAFGILLK